MRFEQLIQHEYFSCGLCFRHHDGIGLKISVNEG